MAWPEAESAAISEDFFSFGALNQKVPHIQMSLQEEMLTAVGHNISFLKRDPMCCPNVKRNTEGVFLFFWYRDYAKLVYD